MGQGDPGVEEAEMNEGTNEGLAHERRLSTNALLTNEGNQRTMSL